MYTLTISLKMLGDNHIFSDIYDYISQTIYSQLSPYGKRIIEESAKKEQLTLEEIDEKAYRYEYDLLDQLLKSKRQGMYTYFIKSREECEIEYREAGELKPLLEKWKLLATVKKNVPTTESLYVKTTGESKRSRFNKSLK